MRKRKFLIDELSLKFRETKRDLSVSPPIVLEHNSYQRKVVVLDLFFDLIAAEVVMFNW